MERAGVEPAQPKDARFTVEGARARAQPLHVSVGATGIEPAKSAPQMRSLTVEGSPRCHELESNPRLPIDNRLSSH